MPGPALGLASQVGSRRVIGTLHCSPTEQVLPMLRFVQTRGNCTVYEWRTGTEPSVVERPHLEEPPEQVEEDAVRQAE